jgi:hypothetical protein
VPITNHHPYATVKVVVNRCYGGFTLSDRAQALLLERGVVPEVERLKGEDDANHLYRRLEKLPRHDPELVKVVEELGEAASGECSELAVVEVQLGYDIRNFDGAEKVRAHQWHEDWW